LTRIGGDVLASTLISRRVRVAVAAPFAHWRTRSSATANTSGSSARTHTRAAARSGITLGAWPPSETMP
jgi:hypothetical protein